MDVRRLNPALVLLIILAVVASTAAAAWLATPAAASAPDALLSGSQLQPDQALWSQNGQYRAEMQKSDGNFVVYGPSGALWASGAKGTGAYLSLQGDGNLVVYRDGARWWTGTNPASNTRLVMQDDGNLVLYSRGGLPLWSSQSGKSPYQQHQITAPARLSAGQQLWSQNGRYRAEMQKSDGNFVVYGPSGALWASGAKGSGAYLSLQGDGNLVVYRDGSARWWTGTNPASNTRLVMQDDGNLVLYRNVDTVDTAIWSSRTRQTSTPSSGASVSALARARSWADAMVPYSQSGTHTNEYGTYRTDCSGLVSLAWGLSSSYTTRTLGNASHEISKSELQAGDVLLNPGDHVVLFAGWVDSTRTRYWAFEQAAVPGYADYHSIPYPYFAGYDPNGYKPYRLN